jgi:hypothetical protein
MHLSKEQAIVFKRATTMGGRTIWKAEAIQETPDMIVGTFLVESHLVEVLFDTGATHSFITASWVEVHNIPITAMATPIHLDSASGKV